MRKNKLHITKKVLTILLPLTLVMTGCTSKKEPVSKKEAPTDNKVVEKAVQDENLSTEQEISEIVPEKPVENYNNEEQVVDYFNNMDQNLDQIFTKEDFQQIKDQVKEQIFSSLVTSVEFFCNRKDIGGYYFNDLTEPTKQKVMEIMERMDQKVTQHYPDYKTYLKEKWNIGYDAFQRTFNSGKEKVKEMMGEDNYNKMVETKDKVKEKAKEKVDDWKNKTKEWYNGIKEEYK